MVRRSKAIVASLFFLTFACSIIAMATTDQPRLEVKEKTYNFGEVVTGDKVVHDFIIKNTGNRELVIEKVEGPVMLGLNAPWSILPGKEGKISFDFDTSEMTGTIKIGATLQTNDPDHPKVELELRGFIKPIVQILPDQNIYFSLYKGQVVEKFATIINNRKEPLKINKFETESDRFNCHLQTIQAGKEYRLVVKVNPHAKIGRTRERVILLPDDKEITKLSVGVNILIKNDVYPFPDDIDFGKIDLQKIRNDPHFQKTLSQFVLVKRREGKGKDFQINCEEQPSFLKIEKTPKSGSETYRLDISLVPEKMKPGKIDTFIILKTNDKEVPQLKIPVVGEVL